MASGISGLYIAFAELFNETLFRGRVSSHSLTLSHCSDSRNFIAFMTVAAELMCAE